MKGKIMIVMAAVIVGTLIFLSSALQSPYRSILLPIKIPVEYNFEYVHVIDPIAGDIVQQDSGRNPYEVVFLANDGSELLRLEPEEARDILKITQNDKNTAHLVWSSYPDILEFSEDNAEESFKPVKVVLTKTLSTDPKMPTTSEVLGLEGNLEGSVEILEVEGITLSNFGWTFSGNSIPVAGGKADTGKWTLTAYKETPARVTVDPVSEKITVKHVSFFSSEYLFAEDSVTGERLPVAFETTLTGSILPSASDLRSYLLSQIYLQVFGWMIPVSVLMAILWVDSRYRTKIQRMLTAP